MFSRAHYLCYCFFCFACVLCSEDWVNGVPLDLNDPRIFAMAAAERHFFDADYDEYADSNSSGAAFCRSAALIVSPHLSLFVNLLL